MQGQLLYTVTAGASGLIIGCYLNTLAYRLSTVGTDHETAFVTEDCICPHCRHPLALWEQIPIIGYLLLGGACRYCGIGISLHYPLTEGGCAFWYAILAALCFSRVPLLLTLALMLLSSVLLTCVLVRYITRGQPFSLCAHPRKTVCGLLTLVWYHLLIAVILGMCRIVCI